MRAADPSAGGRRSAAIFDTVELPSSGGGAYRLDASGAIPCSSYVLERDAVASQRPERGPVERCRAVSIQHERRSTVVAAEVQVDDVFVAVVGVVVVDVAAARRWSPAHVPLCAAGRPRFAKHHRSVGGQDGGRRAGGQQQTAPVHK